MPITDYLNQIAQLKPRTGFDVTGKPTFGTTVSISCRFVESTKRFKDSNGNEYVSDAEVWVLPAQAVALEDVIIYDAINYKVTKVDVRRGIDGQIDHKKAYLARTRE